MSTATITPTVTAETPLCAVPKIFTTTEQGTFEPVEADAEHQKLFRDAMNAAPDWAMDWDTHQTTFQRTAVYRCLSCGEQHEEYRQNPRNLPWAKACTCTGPAIRTQTLPGMARALDAKRFEPILVYERPEGTYSDPNHKYWWPGRNDDPPPADCPNAKPIWLDSSGGLPAIDRFIKNVGSREQEMNDVNNGLRQAHFERARDASRKQLFAQLRDRGLSGENAEKIIRDREGRYDKNTVMQQFEAIARAQGVPFNQEAAERQYERTQATRHNPDYRRREYVNFDIPVISFDSSNRMGHHDPERHGRGPNRKG